MKNILILPTNIFAEQEKKLIFHTLNSLMICLKDILFMFRHLSIKKLMFILTAFLICHTVFSQETEKIKTEPRKNEIKITFPAFFYIPGIEYERLLSKNFGLGLGFAVEPSFIWGKVHYIDEGVVLRITPYSRYYYKSLFIEANTAISKLEYKNAFSLGLVLGCKFVSKKGFLAELFIGGGTYVENLQGGYWHFGVGLGKQF